MKNITTISKIDPGQLNSSYRKNNYGEIFEAISFIQRPILTCEIGVLEGYSAFHLNKYTDKLILFDQFEDCKFRHANYQDIREKFPMANVEKLDFYKAMPGETNHVDLLHIDIANTGNTYRLFMEAYYPNMPKGSITILEGGSEERDNHWWMKAFNKPKIQPVLEEWRQAGIQFHVIEAFPSLTIVRK